MDKILSILFVLLQVLTATLGNHGNTFECVLKSLMPNIGPIEGGTLIALNIHCNFNNTELVQNYFTTEAYVAFDTIKTDVLSANSSGFIESDSFHTTEVTYVSWKYDIYVRAPTATSLSATNNTIVALVSLYQRASSSTSLIVDGKLPYQYYNLSELDFVLNFEDNTNGPLPSLYSTGGQTICIGFDRYTFIQDTSQSTIVFIQGNTSIRYQLRFDIEYSNETVNLCALTNSLLSSMDETSAVSVYVALNGIDYTFAGDMTIQNTIAKVALVFYDAGSFDISVWSSAHFAGLLSVTSKLSSSLQTLYHILPTLGASQAQQLDFVASLIDSQRTINSVDIVMFVAAIDGNALVQLSNMYNDTNFLLCAPRYPDYEQFSNNNIDYYWAELYQSWFLSGYLAGLMVDPKKSGTICYIQTLNDNYNRLLLNAFSHGVMMANKNVTIPVWIAGTTGDAYILSSLATEVLRMGQCDQVASNAFAVLVFKPFTASKKFVSMMNADGRSALGDYVLSSALADWRQAYFEIMQMFFNSHLDENRDEYISLNFDHGAVLLSNVSAFVPPQVSNTLNAMVNRMSSVGADSVVLCGPLQDNSLTNTLQIPPGYCPTIPELYNMTWALSNTKPPIIYKPKPPEFSDDYLNSDIKMPIYICMTLILFMIACMAAWTIWRRDHPIVKFAQPAFLLTTLVGCAVGIFSIIPLSYSRSITNEEAFALQTDGLNSLRDDAGDNACQLAPWLLVTAFGLTFPVLVGKTWRLHRLLYLMEKKMSFTVKSKPISAPWRVFYVVVAFMGILYIPMIIWQIFDPLEFSFLVTEEDLFGNPISSSSSCYRGISHAGYGAFVFSFILLCCLIGNVVCFIARNDESVNNEITYISLGILNYFQMFVIAIPLVLETADSYSRLSIASSAVFVAFGGLSLLIMVPKIIAVEFWDDDRISIQRKKTSRVSMFNSEIVVNVRDSNNPIHRGSTLSTPTDENSRGTEIKNVRSLVADHPSSDSEINRSSSDHARNVDRNLVVPGFVVGLVTTVE